MTTSNKTHSSVLVFTVGMLVAKLSSFFVNMALSYKYGTSETSDILIIVTHIPTILFAGLISAIALSFVPVYKTIGNSSKEKNEFTSNTINVTLVFFSVLCLFVFLFPGVTIKVLATGMSADGIEIAASITRWVALACLFGVVSGVLQGYLQANSLFYIVSISSLPVNLVITAGILISTRERIDPTIGIFCIVAYLLQFFMFFIASKRNGYNWSPIFNIHDKSIKKIILMVIPIFLGSIVYDINTIIDKSISSLIEAGSISVLDYAYKVAGAAQGILAYPLTTILYTKLSESSVNKNYDEIASVLNSGINRLCFIMVPAITGLIITSNHVIRVLFYRGEFNDTSLEVTSICLVLYLIGMYAVSIRALFEKALYSLQLSRLTLLNAIVTVSLNVVLNLSLYKPLGCYGLAIATSISLFVSLIMLFLILKIKIRYKINRDVVKDLIKILISTLIMVVCVLLINITCKLQSAIISIFIDAIVGVGIYIFICYIFKEKTILGYIEAIKAKVNANR